MSRQLDEQHKFFQRMLLAVKRLPGGDLWIDKEERRRLMLREVVKVDPTTHRLSTKYINTFGSGNVVLSYDNWRDPSEPKVSLDSSLKFSSVVYAKRYDEQGYPLGWSLLGGFPPTISVADKQKLLDPNTPVAETLALKAKHVDVIGRPGAYIVIDQKQDGNQTLVRRLGALKNVADKIFVVINAYNKSPNTSAANRISDAAIAGLMEYFDTQPAQFRLAASGVIDAQKVIEIFPTEGDLNYYISQQVLNESHHRDVISFYREMTKDPAASRGNYNNTAVVDIDTFQHSLPDRYMDLLRPVFAAQIHSQPIKGSCYQLCCDYTADLLIEKSKMLYPHELICILAAEARRGAKFIEIQELLEKCSAYIWADLITQLEDTTSPLADITVYRNSAGILDTDRAVAEIKEKYGLFVFDYMNNNGVPKLLVAQQLKTTVAGLDQLDVALQAIFRASEPQLRSELERVYQAKKTYQAPAWAYAQSAASSAKSRQTHASMAASAAPMAAAAASSAYVPAAQQPALSQGGYAPSILDCTKLTAIWNMPGAKNHLSDLKDLELLRALDTELKKLSPTVLDILNIELVNNQLFAAQFDASMRRLDTRQGNPRFNDQPGHGDRSCRASYDKFKEKFKLNNDSSPYVANYLFGCHAVKTRAAVEGIAEGGFSEDSTTGARFGKGIYFSAFLEYVKKYYGGWTRPSSSSSFRDSKFIFIVAVPTHQAECMNQGQAKAPTSLNSRFDLRVIDVDRGNMEMISNAERVLPVAVVEVKKDEYGAQRYRRNGSDQLGLHHTYHNNLLDRVKNSAQQSATPAKPVVDPQAVAAAAKQREVAVAQHQQQQRQEQLAKSTRQERIKQYAAQFLQASPSASAPKAKMPDPVRPVGAASAAAPSVGVNAVNAALAQSTTSNFGFNDNGLIAFELIYTDEVQAKQALSTICAFINKCSPGEGNSINNVVPINSRSHGNSSLIILSAGQVQLLFEAAGIVLPDHFTPGLEVLDLIKPSAMPLSSAASAAPATPSAKATHDAVSAVVLPASGVFAAAAAAAAAAANDSDDDTFVDARTGSADEDSGDESDSSLNCMF